jgi:hypothetical protein
MSANLPFKREVLFRLSNLTYEAARTSQGFARVALTMEIENQRRTRRDLGITELEEAARWTDGDTLLGDLCDLHIQALAGCPVAAEESARIWLKLLQGKLHARFPHLDHDLVFDAAVETITAYLRQPAKFGSPGGEKASLMLVRFARQRLCNG